MRASHSETSSAFSSRNSTTTNRPILAVHLHCFPPFRMANLLRVQTLLFPICSFRFGESSSSSSLSKETFLRLRVGCTKKCCMTTTTTTTRAEKAHVPIRSPSCVHRNYKSCPFERRRCNLNELGAVVSSQRAVFWHRNINFPHRVESTTSISHRVCKRCRCRRRRISKNPTNEWAQFHLASALLACLRNPIWLAESSVIETRPRFVNPRKSLAKQTCQ